MTEPERPRLQLAAAPPPDPESPSTALDLSAAEPEPAGWDDIRRLFVQGVAVGPGYPDRTEVLARLHDPRRPRDVTTRVGKVKIYFPTINAACRFFGGDEAAVFRQARSEDWIGLQRIYRAGLRQRHERVKEHDRLSRVEAIDRRAYTVSKLGLKMIEDRLEMVGKTVEVVGDDVIPVLMDPREMDSLSRASQTWHALARRALGFPVDQVGAMKSPTSLDDDVADPGEGDYAEVGSGSGRFDGGFAAARTGDGTVEDEPNISAELARDDAERLHGFLTVLGRAQEASRTEEGEHDRAERDADAAAPDQREQGERTA